MLSAVPQVETVLEMQEMQPLVREYSRQLLVAAVRTMLAEVRADALAGLPVPGAPTLAVRLHRIICKVFHQDRS